MKSKIKRAICCLLSAATVGTMAIGLAACGGSTGDDHIVMTYIYGGTIPKDLKKVEKAVSDYTQEKIGVSVGFLPLSILEQSKYSTIVGVDTIDLMCVAFGDPLEYYSMDMIQKISKEDVEEYCPDILEMNEEYDMMIRSPKGDIIGIAARESAIAGGGSYVIRKSDLAAVGLDDDYVDQQKITFADLDIIFAALKKQFPTSYPIVSTMDESGYTFAVDILGSNDKKSSGVLDLESDINTTTVVNYYETQGYKDYVAFMRKCYQNEWISRSSETATTTKVDDFNSKKARGVWLGCNLGLKDSYATEAKEECVQLQIVEQYYVPLRSNGIMWGVCGTSKKKAATLKFMNLLWSDKKLMNMVQWGIEGEHFKVIDEENCIIDYADGVTAETTGFYNGLGVYADKRYIYLYKSTVMSIEEQIASKNADLEMAEKATKRSSKAGNFIYDSSKFKSQIANIEQAINQYAKGLALGSGTEADYNAMIKRMKDAGIDQVIADKQAQLDAYLASLN